MNENPLVNRRILIIDDDEIFGVMVEDFLSRKNAFVDSVTDLKQARQILTQSSFDIILLDNYLPDGFGLELMSFLTLQGIDAPVLMITADDDQVSMQKCFVQGVKDYLLKPINLELLWLKLQRVFNTYIIEKQLHSQNEQLARMLDEKQQQENLARHVYRHLSETASQTHHAIRTHLQASTAFNGDLFIAGQAPNGNRMVILVDATGHGLAAAICVLPVVSALKAMVNKGFSLSYIMHEINSKLFAEIPDDRFVACIGVEVDCQRQQLNFFNAGMPDILVIDAQCNVIEKIKSNCLPLGILDANSFSADIHSRAIKKGEHLLFYSDGLTEQTSLMYEQFGKSEFFTALETCNDASLAFDTILNAFNSHISNSSLEDDVSLICVDVGELAHSCAETKYIDNKDENGQFDMLLTVSGQLLAKSNLPGLMDDMLKNFDVDKPMRQKSFTIFSELINNGLDHGILKLSSELKNDFGGFAEFLEQREQRLSLLQPEDKLKLKLRFQSAESRLHFIIEDSGEGYELSELKNENESALAGRGVKLIDKLSERFEVHKPGNITSVIIK